MNILSCLETMSARVADLRNGVRHVVLTMAVLTMAAAIMACAGGFAVAATYMWLETRMSGPAAALCVAGGLALAGLAIAAIALLRGRRRGRTAVSAQPKPSVRETRDLTDMATREVMSKVSESPGMAVLSAVALGVVVGLLRPDQND